MGELSFLLRKVAADKERDQKEWKVAHLEGSVIPYLQHELKTVKELGLEYVSVQSRLNEVLRSYKEMSGKEYHAN